MKRLSIAGIGLAIAVVLSAVAASAASAAFTKGANWVKAGTANGFTGAFWPLGELKLKPTLISSGNTITCTSETSKGQNGGNGSMTVSKAQVTYTGCEGENTAKTKCSVSSSGTGTTVTTELLKGELVLVNKTEATSEVGIRFESETPANGFATLTGTCLTVSPTKPTGKIVGEATPVNLKSLTGGLIFNAAATGNGQQIKAAKAGLPPVEEEIGALKAFGGLAVSQMQAETITFEEATEVHAE